MVDLIYQTFQSKLGIPICPLPSSFFKGFFFPMVPLDKSPTFLTASILAFSSILAYLSSALAASLA